MAAIALSNASLTVIAASSPPLMSQARASWDKVGVEPDPVAVNVRGIAVDGDDRVGIDVASGGPQIRLDVLEQLGPALRDVAHLVDVRRSMPRTPMVGLGTLDRYGGAEGRGSRPARRAGWTTRMTESVKPGANGLTRIGHH
jgi:hypothetical protein